MVATEMMEKEVKTAYPSPPSTFRMWF